ncbi:hypothetical protein GYMLUDRAFT_41109 [Collybiopsis luxurians FD-317 M1]|uniref:Unplaced genomic scaffold GYMLUscaffold_16, whole genome shotgun sequence n=1 Tax=Collybiopsis luxurians FD-317 M1 TaxID=944289 RepID=A0A0D0C5M2_9AGAR|nr:hypothetical protein GYMLUDRAFT_41109 [Collybiopsis luxurians FD-317 M1]
MVHYHLNLHCVAELYVLGPGIPFMFVLPGMTEQLALSSTTLKTSEISDIHRLVDY